MLAYTSESGPKLWPLVDFVNVMAYDLMNRRDNVTQHHTSVVGAEDSIKNYLNIGAPASKLNLGFAYYAKYFTTQGDCSASPLNCPIVPAEDPNSGDDTLTSGAWTFEKQHMAPVDVSRLTVSYDGTCGPDKGTKCASGCCSQYGNCGTSPAHCSGACQHAFGTGCTDTDVAASWQNAAKYGVTDQQAGGQYYFDPANRLFWTWDTPELISRKFDDIVRKYNLGGVMAWSLGEDSYDWSHIKRMADELKKSPSTPKPSPTYTPPKPSSKKPKPTPKPRPTYAPAPPPSYPSYNPAPPAYPTKVPADYHTLPGNPVLESDPNLPYDVVWVDGTTDGPAGDYSTPGSPADYAVDWPSESEYPSAYPVSQPVHAAEAPAAPAPAPAPTQQYDDGSWSPGKYGREAVEGAKLPGTTEQPAGYLEEPAVKEEEPQYEQSCQLRRVRKRGVGRK
jgi:hypothetical protein